MRPSLCSHTLTRAGPSKSTSTRSSSPRTASPTLRATSDPWLPTCTARSSTVVSSGPSFLGVPSRALTFPRYPDDKKSKSGKLRLLYEGFPMAFLTEQVRSLPPRPGLLTLCPGWRCGHDWNDAHPRYYPLGYPRAHPRLLGIKGGRRGCVEVLRLILKSSRVLICRPAACLRRLSPLGKVLVGHPKITPVDSGARSLVCASPVGVDDNALRAKVSSHI